ncbi:MAG: hypothetical protein Q4B08_13765, partial [Propionibacteriaceae bacterium]|nr:hypothetical protein [Propionibacteriaceae bacterium]
MSKGQVIGWCAVAACWALSSCAAVGGGAASGGAAGAGPVAAAVPAVAGSGVTVAPRSDPAGIVPTEGMCMISPVRTVAELADRE